jgi:hypothetical protein
MWAMAFHEQVRLGDTATVGQRELEGFVERASAVAESDYAKDISASETEARPAPGFTL